MSQLPELLQFEKNPIRSTMHEGELYFVIVDVVTAITDSKAPGQYIKDMRRRDKELAKGWVKIATPLSVVTAGGKQRMNCANREGLFRIIQAIPSPKAEPFRLWLAKVGAERLEEIEDPMKAITRAKEHYRKKGYSDKWINTRMQSKQVRDILTDEWNERGVENSRQYGTLTNEIHKGAFDLTVKQHKEHKDLKSQNLRDHMTLTELAINILAEASTIDIARGKNAKGFTGNLDAAREGGEVAGNARRDIESRTGKQVVSKQNFRKRLKGKKDKA